MEPQIMLGRTWDLPLMYNDSGSGASRDVSIYRPTPTTDPRRRAPGSRIRGEKLRGLITAYDGTGYQFLQTRGIAVIDSPIGLVACIPMGMAQVSSVVITAEEGVTLRKGEELGYFQFGGSDFVMVFERASNVRLFGTPLLDDWPNVHVQQGTAIGNAYPYS